MSAPSNTRAPNNMSAPNKVSAPNKKRPESKPRLGMFQGDVDLIELRRRHTRLAIADRA